MICLSSFHFFQFFSNLFKYSSSNFQSSHLYNNFAIYFPGNSILLYSSTSSSCFLTSTPPHSNSSINFSAFFKFSFLSQVSPSAIKPFHYIKYFTTPLIFFLFNIFSTSHFSTPSTSTGFPSSFFYSFTCSLYLTIRLTFTTGWILIKLGNHNFTTFDDTISSIIYSPTYLSINFFVGLSLNTRSLVLNSTQSPFFHTLVSFLPLSTYFFISSCIFLNAASAASSCTFFILSMNAVALSTFSFLLMSPPILNSFP